ncbi:PREDICTED: LOW QUALITY PROTEIN: xanthine dehydrogenase-like [Trachymyrmex cornetzi]|uniref:LOW QUALITY PROTEIN: xanthine dehydrogenase-like n=1 Tax=Trachymyrmex cornetzi TaxID=471704 RepID=UPI00084F22D1|nr:PREDICTED: LOW QUALITY PROTEIN: xanthine dehydrogenase-like [Trachymyrmex cornetzi]
MCHAGDCGACVVSVTFKDKTIAVNSCLVLVLTCDRWNIVTTEGIGNKRDGYHAIQATLAKKNGSQCGYCSPGMVMNMYSLGKGLSMRQIESSFGGNICRCTGYRAILDAFKGLATDAHPSTVKDTQDIEELYKIKPCQKNKMPCVRSYYDKQPSDEKKMLIIKLKDAHFYKVTTIKDVFTIFDNNPNATYILNGGNTAHGVYLSSKKDIYIDINDIPDLHKILKSDIDLVLGGSLTLTTALETFQKYSNDTGFKYLRQLAQHVELIANGPVRNIGTIAGNLMMKHQHNEFSSDLFLMLESVGAQVVVQESPSESQIFFLFEFLNIRMDHKIINRITLYPLRDNSYQCRFYKIMPRAQNAHGHVGAGFLFPIDENGKVLKLPNIIFNGINMHFLHAKQTEELVVGKSIFDKKIQKLIMEMLHVELQPDHVLPDYSPEFRRTLAEALLYKFFLSLQPEKVDPFYRSGGTLLERNVSSGKQEYNTHKELWPVSKPMPKLEAFEQTSGEVRYCNDMGPYLREVFCAFVVTEICNGEIESIDTRNALKMKGVEAFFSVVDIPGKNLCISAVSKLTSLPEDELLFAEKDVLYAGQPVGVIVAETHSLANEAAKLVQIIYKEPLKTKPVISIEDALNSQDNTRIRESANIPAKRKGTDIKHVINGVFQCGGQYHHTLETQSCVCVPVDDDIDVYPSSQWMDLIQVSIANCLNVQNNSINVHVNRLGGSYGSKISRNAQISCACALVCHILRRPARFIMTTDSNMQSIGKRCSTRQEYKIGVNNDGVVQYLNSKHWSNCGSSFNEPQAAMIASYMQRSCYLTDTWTFNGFDVRTDLPSNTFCQASGSAEGVAMIENLMEHIAKVTNKDPIEVRLANMNDIDKSVLKPMIEDLLKKANYDNSKSSAVWFNSENRWKKQEVALVPMKYLITFEGQFHAMVSICARDGSVCVTHSGIEIDQGINTKIAQIAANVLQVDIDTVSVKGSNNLASPNKSTTGHSVTVEYCGNATLHACLQIMIRLEPIRNKMKNPTWKELIFKAYELGIDLCASYTIVNEPTEDIYGVATAVVEIDVLTGQHVIRRVDLMIKNGVSLNPEIDIGQVEGAFVMGIGYWTSEDLIYSPDTGVLTNNRLWNYKSPGAKDIPEDFRVYLLSKSFDGIGIYGSESIEESSLCMSYVIPIAFRYALNSARADAGNTKWYQLDGPCTTERILLTSLTNKDMMVYEKEKYRNRSQRNWCLK